MSDERARREREFHDERFRRPEPRKRRVGRFYAITDTIRRRFRDAIVSQGAGGRVLELGCGAGTRTVQMAKAGASVTAVDVSPVALRKVAGRVRRAGVADQVTLVEMDAGKLTFDDASFDLVCGSSILHHLDLGAVGPAVARVLRPGGTGVFLEPLGHNLLINGFRRLTPSIRSADERPLRMSDLRRLEAWFDTVEVDYYYLLSLLAAPAPLRRALPALERIDRCLLRVPLLQRQAWQALITVSGPRGARLAAQ